MVWILKAGGQKEKFNKHKVYKTCLRSGVPKNIADKIASETEQQIYDGITSRKILHIVLKKLENYEKHHSLLYDLKDAIAKLDPAEHEFEKYIRHILNEHGYNTNWNVIVQGECIEHQIDIVAEKNGKRYLVECKHHINPHRFSGLGTSITAWAVLDDIQKGFKKGKCKKFDNMWLIINTKFSEHAIRYSTAKGLILTSWNYPKDNDLRYLIQRKGMYPITLLGLKEKTVKKFSKAGILLVKEIANKQWDELYSLTKMRKRRLEQIINLAKNVVKPAQ